MYKYETEMKQDGRAMVLLDVSAREIISRQLRSIGYVSKSNAATAKRVTLPRLIVEPNVGEELRVISVIH